MTRSSHTDAKEMISDIERLTPDLCAIGDDNFRYRTVSPKSICWFRRSLTACG